MGHKFNLKPLVLTLALGIAGVLGAGYAAAAEVPVRVEGLEKLPKGNKKLLMGNFVVEYQESYISTKKGFHIMGIGGFKQNTATNDLRLPEPGVLGELTNFIYARTLEKLRAQGWEVVEPAGFKPESKDAARALAESAPVKNGMTFDNIEGASTLYTPSGYPGWVSFGGGCDHFIGMQEAHLNLLNRLGKAGEKISRGVNEGMQNVNERKLAKLEALPLLKVWITVGFGEATAKGAGSMISGRQKDYVTGTETTTVANAANSNATAGMFLKPDVTRITIQLPPEGDPSFIGFSRSCGTTLFNAFKPPVDGEVRVHLADKWYDDGGKVASLETQAGNIQVKDTPIGGGLAQRTVKEQEGKGVGRAAGGNEVQIASTGSNTSGRLYMNGGLGGDVLNTQQTYVTTIRADYYATSALKMMEDVTSAFISRLTP